ncbi:MAG: penicillin-binding protein 1A, partial [Sphingomonadaceae bacterium]
MRFILRLFGWLFAAGTIVFVIGAVVAGGFIWHYSKDLPDSAQLRNYEPPVMSRVHAGDGSLIAEFARERRLYLPIQAIPKLVIDAYLSAEDKNFYKHMGVDPEGLVRAAITNFRNRASGRRPQGASTITQQVAKNFLVGSEQSLERKIREALIALRIEGTYSKDKILELYLNEIYLGAPAPGQGSYGVAAAALNYFGKSVHELNLQEVAYLAALPKAPTDLHPFRNRERAIERRNYVLDRMAENGMVKREEAEAAKKQPLGVNPRTVSPNNIAAGYFAEEIRRELQDRYGEKKLLEGGLSVRATVDPKMQLLARKSLVDGLVRFDEARGWRGAIQKLDISARDWGIALGDLPVLGDVAPWRLAVVLEVSGDSARLGLHPGRENSGHLKTERDTVTLTGDGIRWTRRARVAQAVSVGDVVYVEPMDSRPGQVRLRQMPEVNGAITVMDPYSGRVLA